MNKHDWFLFYLLTTFVFGCVLFLLGFFPVDFEKGDSTPPPEPPTTLDGISLKRPPRHVSNVVLMIVDALRYDFVTKKQMPYSNDKCKIKLKVAIPTVTLPRIKSLTSGTISNFIDVVLNLGSSQTIKDSILHLLHKRGDKIVFYGDYTWVNLFSNVLARHEANTDSFYIREFTKGDNAITGNLRNELKNVSSWDFLILHYYGLDRIGHMEGSEGGKIFLKLREMDDVVELIDKTLSEKNSELKPLLLVTADHGMRNSGGHGGSSPEEIYVPLIINSNCTRQDGMTLQYNQVDIAPTLAVLLDVPIPFTSIGCIIPELLVDKPDEDKLYALYYNTKFLVDKSIAKYGKNNVANNDYYSWYETATDAHKKYLTTLMNEQTSSAYLFEQAKLNYIRSAEQVSQLFASSYTRFDFGTIILGVTLTTLTTIIMLLTCITSAGSSRNSFDPEKYFGRILLAAVAINAIGHFFNYLDTSSVTLMCLTTIPIFISIIFLIELFKILTNSRMHFNLDIPVSIAFGVIFQTFSLASTSFIEEEHQTWYYLGVTFWLSLIWRNISKTKLKVITFNSSSMERDISIFFSVLRPVKQAFFAMALTVFVRRLNQTGDKWMRVPDVGDWLADNKIFLSGFLAISLLLLTQQLMRINTPLQSVACVLACTSVYCYHGVMGEVIFFHGKHFNPFLVLPFFWTSVLYIIGSSYWPVIMAYKKKVYNTNLCQLLGTNLTVFALISTLLHKPHNVFLVFAMHFILRSGYNLCDSFRGRNKVVHAQIILVYKVGLTICISKMFYFYQGNSNSLATIDLNPGFVGLNFYNPFFMVIMVTANTFFSEIFGFLHLLLNIFQKQHEISITKETNEFENNLVAKNNYNMVTTLMASIKLLITSVYLVLMIVFRHHLFIYTVFSPKVFYECFGIFLFFFNFSMTNLYLSVL